MGNAWAEFGNSMHSLASGAGCTGNHRCWQQNKNINTSSRVSEWEGDDRQIIVPRGDDVDRNSDSEVEEEDIVATLENELHATSQPNINVPKIAAIPPHGMPILDVGENNENSPNADNRNNPSRTPVVVERR